MQFARFTAMEFGELGAKTRQRSRQAARSRTRPRTAQDRTFKYGDRALKPLEIKPQQRVLEQSQRIDRGGAVQRGERGQPGKSARRRIGERFAA